MASTKELVTRQDGRSEKSDEMMPDCRAKIGSKLFRSKHGSGCVRRVGNRLTNDDLLDSFQVHLLARALSASELAETLVHVANTILVHALGVGVATVRGLWGVVLLAPAKEPEPIVVGVDCIVSGMADEAEAGNVLVRQVEGDHLVDLSLN